MNSISALDQRAAERRVFRRAERGDSYPLSIHSENRGLPAWRMPDRGGKARPYWNCGTRLPGGETYGQLGLGQGMTSVGLNDLHVVILDPPVGIKVVTEVSAGDRLTHLALDLSLVGLFDCSIGVGVTG